jgi:hypothetical protein
LADPEAGRVDDFQMGSQQRVDAFQIKWSQFGGPFTFNDLVKAGAGSPSLIAQLADGWKRLRASHAGDKVVVHLVTNQTPSVSDSVRADHRKPGRRHFAGFLAEAWNVFRASAPDTHIPAVWSTAWETMRQEASLSGTSFGEFVHDCELEFGYQTPQFVTPRTRDQRILDNDWQQLTQFLFRVIADKTNIVELTRDELIDGLGWRARLEFKSRHEFPVDERLYEPVESTTLALEKALADLPGGYIAVVGTPGSGKSTLLTKLLRTRRERIVRYYAYVPDALDPLILRGESVNFLHDVVVDLERAGFRVGEGLPGFDRDDLLGRLHGQLQLLHKDWHATGRATLILVDGLDHIEREERPTRSLLRDLPLPEQVPEGIYFILGSQTDAPFPDRIQFEVRKPERRIGMNPLDRGAVFRIIERSEILPPPSEAQKDRIYDLSGGHPLCLAYLLNRLPNTDSSVSIESVLDSAEAYEGNIEKPYYSYWKEIESDPPLTHLLGLLARLRTVIDWKWVRTWADSNVVKKFVRSIGHYFRQEDDSRWYFFHDSFRVFLIRQTAESQLGLSNTEADQVFHRELAEICSRQSTTSRWSWEELFHLARAGQHDAVLQRACAEWFRSQLMALRPLDTIESDILLALRSAAALQDPIALGRIVLAGAEISQRGWYLEKTSLLSLLLELEDRQIAVEYVRDGNRLRVNPRAALGISTEFNDCGWGSEARKIFDLAEPIALLSSPNPVEDEPQRANDEILEAWAEAAVVFRPLAAILDAIRRICRQPDRLRQMDAESATRDLRNSMMFSVGLGLLHAQQWDDLVELGSEFMKGGTGSRESWFRLQSHAWQNRFAARDKVRARGFLEQTLAVVKEQSVSLGDEAKVALAEAILLILGDRSQARQLVEGVAQPNLVTDAYRTKGGLGPFLQRFRLNRLLSAFGEGQSPTAIVPNPSDPRHEGIVYFERALCVVAEIWGTAWRGDQLSPSEVTSHSFPLLRLFNRKGSDTQDWASWYVARGARGEFYALLVKAVAQHGPAALGALREAFSEEWGYSENAAFWPSDVRREIVLAFVNVGVDRTWATKQLTEIETKMLEGQDVSGRIEECINQALAWNAVNEREVARATLRRVLKVSFGVGYRKDYQFDSWMEWLDRINRLTPEGASERIMWFARAVASLRESTEGRAAEYAAEELLTIAFRWSPRRSIELLRWFASEHVLWYEEALKSLLSATLEASAPPVGLVLDFVADAFLPITTTASPKLAESLIGATAKQQGTQRAIDAARRLLNAVQRDVLPSERRKWRKGLARVLRKLDTDLEQLGLDATDLLPDEDEAKSSAWLRLKDGSLLSKAEVQAAASNVSDFQKLIEGEAEGSYFDWEPTVAALVERLDCDQVGELAQVLRGTKRPSRTLAHASRRLRALGDANGAWKLAQEAVTASEPWGWDQHYDGGSRLAAFEALIDADPSRGRQLAYRALLNDVGTRSALVGPISLDLHRLLSLFADAVPIAPVWPDVERHIKGLFESSELPDEGPARLGDTYPRDLPGDAVVDVLLLHLEHPVSALAASARRCLRNGLQRGDTFIHEAVRRSLRSEEALQESAMMAVEAAASENPSVVAPFQDLIVDLLKSRNHAIRNAARRTAQRIGYTEMDSSRRPMALPGAYQISLPEIDKATASNQLESLTAGLLVDPADPLELARPFDPIFKFVARESGLPVENLLYRASRIMRELVPESSWSDAAEKVLRRELEEASLRLPFRKPRAAVARRALFNVVGELVDTQRLEVESLDRLEQPLRFYDPAMILCDPGQRPPDIPAIGGREKYGGRNKAWVAAVPSAVSCACRNLADGRVVLAEETRLRRLDWETPTEVRRSSLDRAASGAKPVGGEFFATSFNRLVSEYSDMADEDLDDCLVIRHDAYCYESPGVNWLALAPAVGRQCGWKFVDKGLFRWADDQGQIMVESIWWLDGLFDQSPPHPENEVGEGWLVVAKPEAVSAIRAARGPMKRRVNITRKYQDKTGSDQQSVRTEEDP